MKKPRTKPTADQLKARVACFVAALRRDSSLASASRLLGDAVAQARHELRLGVEKRIDGEGLPTPAPSADFQSAFTRYGGLTAWCEFCDTTYFATWNENEYEPGELEELRKLAADPSKKHVEWGDVSSISHGELDGRQFVYDCDCKAAAGYESFVWNHRYSIAEYLKKRAKDEKDGAAMIERLAADADTVNAV